MSYILPAENLAIVDLILPSKAVLIVALVSLKSLP